MRLFSPVRLIAAALFSVLASIVAAQDNPVVVELYTSQGCSSCPPADAMLRDLGGRDDVIPLALHVDYWDYIGWADVFASPQYTDRQRQYARVAGDRTVYTPQMVVGGRDYVVGARPGELMGHIADQMRDASGVSLAIGRSGGTLSIEAQTTRALSGPLMVQVVRYMPRSTVDIRRGENAGNQFTYSHIVTDWRSIGEWSGGTPLSIQVPVSGSEPVVVILQERGPGAILASARLR